MATALTAMLPDALQTLVGVKSNADLYEEARQRLNQCGMDFSGISTVSQTEVRALATEFRR